MRVTKYINREGKTQFTLGIDGTIKQVLINSLKDNKAQKLENARVSLMLNNIRVIDNYYGSAVDDFNVIDETYIVNEATKFEIDNNVIDNSALKYPVLITFIYDGKDKEKDFRAGVR